MSTSFKKYFSVQQIQLAFYRVQCWPDKTIKDRTGLRAFEQNIYINSKALSQKVISGQFLPQKGFKFYMPKPSRTQRTKTMLWAEDAIVFQAIVNQIAQVQQPVLADLDEFVFGSIVNPEVVKGTNLLDEDDPNFFFFKPWQGLYQKFKESVLHSITKDEVRFKFETDITGFFDSIPHYNLLSTLSEKFGVEDEILDLLSDCLNIWSGTKENITPGVGIPQGPPPSSFLANLLLHNLDNLIVGQGYNYYRYMDDIKIYGYEESELIEALIIIDNYTKGNGLSINSKKTSIETLHKEDEEKNVKNELKRISSFTLYDEDLNFAGISEIFTDEKVDLVQNSDNLDREITRLSEQDPSRSDQEYWQNSITLEDPDEIKAFWTNQFKEVEKELPKFFIKSKPGETLRVKEDIEDTDFIRLSAQYANSFKALKQLGQEVQLDNKLIKYWLFAYQKYFWRANNLGVTLGFYGNSKKIKDSLIELYETQFKHYEWVRYYLIMTLSFNHEFKDQELRKVFFQCLKSETSDLVKISLYRLLFQHSKSQQFTSSLKNELKKESSIQLKLIITDFNRNKAQSEADMLEFINTIGL